MKKILSMLLVLMFTVSSVQCVAFGAEAAAASDTVDTKAELLQALGVTDGVSQTMNKALLARMSVGVLLGGNTPVKVETIETIKDLSKEPTYGDYISFAVANDLFELNNGTFEPSAPVTKSMLNSVALKLLGYSGLGTQTPDYKVISLGLYKDIAIKDDSNISFAEACGFFYNLLDATVVERTYGDNPSFVLGKENVLSVMFDMERVHGVIDTPYSRGTSDEDCIYIGSQKYKVTDGMGKYLDYTGYAADVYVTMDTSNPEVVYVDTEAGANKVLAVYAPDIIGIADNKLEYYNKSGKRADVSIDGVTVLYNGHVVSNRSEYFDIPSGVIRFINANSSNPYALIETYNTMIVGARTEDMIYDINDPSASINIEELETYSIYKDGNLITFEDLKKNDVLSIFDSRDIKHAKIVVAMGNVTGKVTSTTNDTITIDRKEYEFTQYYLNNYSVNVGDEITAYLNHEGLIASVVKINTWNYGYLHGIGSDGSGLSSQTQMKVLNENGIFEIYDLADKVDVNGTTVNKPSATGNNVLTNALRVLTYTDSEGKLAQKATKDYVRQIIKYKLNGDGEIRKIRTAVISDDYDNDDILRITAAPDEAYTTQIKYIGAGCFWKVAVGSLTNTKIFDVPMTADNSFKADGTVDESKRYSIDDKYYRTYPLSTMNSNTKWFLYAYDTTEGGTSACIALSNGAAGGNSGVPSSTAFVISEVRKGMYDDREATILYGMYNKEIKRYVLSPDFEPITETCTKLNGETVQVTSLPEKGDIVNIAVDSFGVITNVDMVFKYSEMASWDAVEMETVENCIIPGYVYSFDDAALTLSTTADDSGTLKLYNLNTNARCYVFDLDNDKLTLGSFEELKSYRNTNGSPSFCAGIATWGRAHTYIFYEGEDIYR